MNEAANQHLESRALRYFMAVADELHFGRAAERLYITQPALSRAIQKLESDLGVPLLTRGSSGVALTAAGKALAQAGASALEGLDAAAAAARRAPKVDRVHLVIAADADVSGIPRLRSRFEAEASVPLDITVAEKWTEPERLVRDGDADAALLLGETSDPTGLEFETISAEPRVVALASSHPLSGSAVLSYADLIDEPLPSIAACQTEQEVRAMRFVAGEDDESLVLRGHSGSLREPRRGPVFQEMSQMLTLIELGQLIAFLPVWKARRHMRMGISYVPVSDVSPGRLHIAWRAGSRSVNVAQLVYTASEVAQEESDPEATLASLQVSTGAR